MRLPIDPAAGRIISLGTAEAEQPSERSRRHQDPTPLRRARRRIELIERFCPSQLSHIAN